MGIYSSGNIYGIRIYLIINDDENVLFEIKMDTILSDEKKKEAKIFYNELSKNDTNKVRIQIYTKCSSTYNNEEFMMWEEITLDYFLQKFDI
jgi:hypothetical protein